MGWGWEMWREEGWYSDCEERIHSSVLGCIIVVRIDVLSVLHHLYALPPSPSPSLCTNRFDHVTRANTVNAVETLLVTDELFRCVQGKVLGS